jgi:uncharacterized membrane protein
MKKTFSTGLGIILPIALTFVIVIFLINFLTKPFLSLTQGYLLQTGIFKNSILYFNEAALIMIASKALILVMLLLTTLILGLVGKLFLIDYLLNMGNYLLHRLPFINKIYKTSQDVVERLFSSKSKLFSEVVFVPFPSMDSLSIGLVTQDALFLNTSDGEEELVPVYVPGTPNPTVGYLLMFKKSHLIYVDMKAEEAMKFIISFGKVMPDFKLDGTNEKQ